MSTWLLWRNNFRSPLKSGIVFFEDMSWTTLKCILSFFWKNRFFFPIWLIELFRAVESESILAAGWIGGLCFALTCMGILISFCSILYFFVYLRSFSSVWVLENPFNLCWTFVSREFPLKWHFLSIVIRKLGNRTINLTVISLPKYWDVPRQVKWRHTLLSYFFIIWFTFSCHSFKIFICWEIVITSWTNGHLEASCKYFVVLCWNIWNL